MIHEVLSELFVHNMELFYIVMRLQSNVGEEIDEAMRDYQSNNFVRDRAWVNRKNKTEA